MKRSSRSLDKAIEKNVFSKFQFSPAPSPPVVKSKVPEPILWSTYGYEILTAVSVKDYNLDNFSLVLRHNESNVFSEKLGPKSNFKDVLKKLEVMGKESCNNHISGFCCVAERTRLMPPHSSVSEFHKVGVTVKSFVELNLIRLLKDLALNILQYCDCEDDIVVRAKDKRKKAEMSPSAFVEPVDLTYDADVVMDIESPVSETMQLSSPTAQDSGWMLVVHSIPGKYQDLDHDWMKFLRMCLEVANTLGVSNRENMYQNCLKAMMTTKHISHMSPYECVVKLPTGDMVKVGECDIMVEFGTGRHYLVELKVCSQWRKYESQVKKYINACHSINRKIAGAAIVNFNPKGMVEVVMFECNMRHSVC